MVIKAAPPTNSLDEVEALKDRIEQLEQLVGRLTLQNDLLKRAKDHYLSRIDWWYNPIRRELK
jgi:hypothetical protein